MLEYVLVGIAVLLVILYFSSAEHATNWILFPPRAAPAPRTIPVMPFDVPKPPAMVYQPRVIAHGTYEGAHKLRLRDTIKNPVGMTLADQALEYKFLNPGA
jgi:hypothetical protein